jgi:parallel beta-helix repeat protein
MKKTPTDPEIATAFKGTFDTDPYMEAHMPRTVAILPFVDRSRSQEGFEIVRKGFYNHFSGLPFTDVELYQVDRLLRKAGLTDPEVIADTPPQQLGEILNVDAVVVGDVSNFDKFYAVLYSQVAVGAKIEMFDTESGHFLWRGEHVTRKHEGGISTSPVGIVATVVSTAMNMRDIQLLRACDDLFRGMVTTIPVPTMAEATLPPVIALLTQDTKGLPKKAGDEIKVVIQGDPKMQASFDIGTFKQGIDMVEVEPGGYLGTYTVVPGDNIREALVTGYLSDDSGNMTTWIDPVGSVTIDTTPPERPQALTAVGRDGVVSLNWAKNAEPDLAGYRVLRSETPLSGFDVVGTTEFNHYKNEGVSNLQSYYFRVSAVDQAGNESKPTDAVMGIAVPPGPTPVSGMLTEDTVWYAGASPYVLEGPVTVKDKATLTIEPGTIVQAKGGGLLVEGGVRALGNATHLIVFEGVGHQSWEGISFYNVKSSTNVVASCKIRDARAGITCRSSSPVIKNCEFIENTDGIRVIGAFSEPEILNNTIHKNAGTGLIVEEGAKPLVDENTIRENARGGVLIQGSAPLITHNTIAHNDSWGMRVDLGRPKISGNNIHDNASYDMVGAMSGEALTAPDNWWGTANGPDILMRIKGRVNIAAVLDGPYPGGKSTGLPVLAGPLGGNIGADAFLTFSNSPYTIERDVVVDDGATLYVEPGVKLLFDQNTSIILEDGGVVAQGKSDRPILFTSSGASPSAGDYLNAVRFSGRTEVSSFFKYCVMMHATTAVDVHYGSPEITHCHVANNAQSGIACRNDAAPKISFSTLKRNMGTGGIECVGMSKPKINHNNIVQNAVGIQAFSTILIDARNNWWGAAPPDSTVIWGDNVNVEPWLTEPEQKAFMIDD